VIRVVRESYRATGQGRPNILFAMSRYDNYFTRARREQVIDAALDKRLARNRKQLLELAHPSGFACRQQHR
jgi:hypothetical protein